MNNSSTNLSKCPLRCKGKGTRSSFHRAGDNRAYHIIVCSKCGLLTKPALTPITAVNRWEKR